MDDSMDLIINEENVVSNRLSSLHLVDLSDDLHDGYELDCQSVLLDPANTNKEELDISFCSCDRKSDTDQNSFKSSNEYFDISNTNHYKCTRCEKRVQNYLLLRNSCCFDETLKISENLKEESTCWLEYSFDKKSRKGFIPNDIYTSDDSGVSFSENNVKICNSKPNLISNDYNLVLEDMESLPSSSSLHINNLPIEIKLKMFSFLTQRELCRYVAPVCQSWFQLSKDPFLWHEILFEDFEDINTCLFVQVLLSWCQNVTKIQFNNRFDLTETDLLNVFKNCPFIEDLSFAFCNQVNDKILSLLSTHCKTLTSINLEGCSIYDESFYHFIGLPLTSIGVSHCNQISDEGAIFVVQNFKSIKHVNFDGIQWITEVFVEKLVEYHSQTIEKIYLDGENLSDNVIRLLAKCENLKVLSFSFCTFMSHHAFEWLSECRNLHHLQLRKGEHFTNPSLLFFFQNMKEQQGLNFKYLNLSECTELSDECLFYIAEKCPNLEVLDLSWCWEVSDDGLQFIIDKCKHMKKLYLQGLHELYGVPFVRIPVMLPELDFLDLSQCNKIRDELIENVVRKMKQLIIHNYYGDSVVNIAHRKSHLLR